jgi:hypothetical protein
LCSGLASRTPWPAGTGCLLPGLVRLGRDHQALTSEDTFDMASARAFTAAELLAQEGGDDPDDQGRFESFPQADDERGQHQRTLPSQWSRRAGPRVA